MEIFGLPLVNSCLSPVESWIYKTLDSHDKMRDNCITPTYQSYFIGELGIIKMASKRVTLHFRTTAEVKQKFEARFTEGERSKVLRHLLERLLSNSITIPTNVLQE